MYMNAEEKEEEEVEVKMALLKHTIQHVNKPVSS